MGFAIPIENWLNSDLKDKVSYYINDARIEKQGIFNASFTQKLKYDFYSGKKELSMKLWYLLMFQMWYAKWME